MSPAAKRIQKTGRLVTFIIPISLWAVSSGAEPAKVNRQAPPLEISLPASSIAASETTYTGWDFGYVVQGGFLNLINNQFTPVDFVITLSNLPGTTASPSSGTIPAQSVQQVLIFTDRSNVPIGEYIGTIRVIYLPDDTIIVPLHYFVADTIIWYAFHPRQDSVLVPGSMVSFAQGVFFTLWSYNTGTVNWRVNNSSGVRISRNFTGFLDSKGVWEWSPFDDVVIPDSSPTVTSISSFAQTGNPVTDDFFAVTYQTTGGRPATTRGDLNGDGFLTSADVVLELKLVFLGELPPAPAWQGDVNCDGLYTPPDVVLLLTGVFVDPSNLCPP